MSSHRVEMRREPRHDSTLTAVFVKSDHVTPLLKTWCFLVAPYVACQCLRDPVPADFFHLLSSHVPQLTLHHHPCFQSLKDIELCLLSSTTSSIQAAWASGSHSARDDAQHV